MSLFFALPQSQTLSIHDSTCEVKQEYIISCSWVMTEDLGIWHVTHACFSNTL
jgi:hypothetical protein